MKKILITTLVFAIVSAIVLSSCSKVNCANLIIKVSEAQSNFGTTPSTANCTALKSAIQAWLANSNCSGTDVSTSASFQSQLDSLICP
jgi:hypothetical protein